MRNQVEGATRQLTDSGAVRLLGRVGLVAYGVVHLLIAYLAVQVAVSGGGKKADKGGALSTLADAPGGKALLWILAVGLFALALWQAAEAAWGYRYVADAKRRTRRRVTSAAEVVVFGFLAVSMVTVATGGSSGGGQEKTYTARALELPGGQLLVGAVGLAVVAVAAFLVHRGWTARFTEDLDFSGAPAKARRVGITIGRVGWCALGAVYGIIGALVVVAAATYDPQRVSGLDGALKTLAGQPFGATLLVAMAVGLACFGAYCLLDARYRRG